MNGQTPGFQSHPTPSTHQELHERPLQKAHVILLLWHFHSFLLSASRPSFPAWLTRLSVYLHHSSSAEAFLPPMYWSSHLPSFLDLYPLPISIPINSLTNVGSISHISLSMLLLPLRGPRTVPYFPFIPRIPFRLRIHSPANEGCASFSTAKDHPPKDPGGAVPV